MTPEMAKKFSELRKKKKNLPEKPAMTFTQYYNKRFLEEAKFFIENPKFRMKYMMVMAHLQKTIKEKSIKEYQEKYPGYPIDELETIKEVEPTTNDDKSTQTETESMMSDYDIIDDTNNFTLNEVVKTPNFNNNKDLNNVHRDDTTIGTGNSGSTLSSSNVPEEKKLLRRSYLNEVVKKLPKFNKDLEKKIHCSDIKNIDPSESPSSLANSNVVEEKKTLRRSRRLQTKTF